MIRNENIPLVLFAIFLMLAVIVGVGRYLGGNINNCYGMMGGLGPGYSGGGYLLPFIFWVLLIFGVILAVVYALNQLTKPNQESRRGAI